MGSDVESSGSRRDDPGTGEEIAVVGLAGRFPGADDVPTLWRDVCAGVDAMHDYTDDELAAAGIGPTLRADPAHVRAHGRLANLAGFDAEFFGMDEQDAARLDPQHRLFLEQSWVALEDAGCDPTRYPGTIGVYSGCSANRYFLFHLLDNPRVARPDPDDWEARLLHGVTPDHLPTQVAYRLGLTGPAVAVQAACASSLVAICHAAQSLTDYRCDLVLAGGVAVTAPRYRYTPGGLVSPDGRCRAFDAQANGAGLATGVAVVALKRMADALADRDRVYARLRGWAVNNDGRLRAGYAAPGVAGQSAVVAEALTAAEVSAESIGMLEAHASATPVGDAIEVSALTRAFNTPLTGFCALGSVKTNLGNLDAATGAVALVKAVCSVREGLIPGHPHFTTPNPAIDFTHSPFLVPTTTTAWPDGSIPRRAGVSSFGLGGTNAHVIVEQVQPIARRSPSPRAEALLLSARTVPALMRVATALRQRLAQQRHSLTDPGQQAAYLGDVAYTLAMGRRVLAHRAAVLCADLAGALDGLDQLIERGSPGGITSGEPTAAGADAAGRARAWLDRAEVGADAFQGREVRVTSLPSYPWQRRRCWIEPVHSPRASTAAMAGPP